MANLVDTPALLTDSRVLELSADEARAPLRRALAQAFGTLPTEASANRWTLRTRRGGLVHEVHVELCDQGAHRCRVSVAVNVDRAVGRRVQLGTATLGMIVAWLAAALYTFADFHQSIYDNHGRVVPWVASLLAAFAFTALVRYLVGEGRVDATGALRPIEALWHVLDTVEARPRVAKSYRVAPRLGLADEAEIEAEAEAEAASKGVRGAAAMH